MTGADLLRYTNQRIDQAYSGYWDNAKWNRVFQQGFTNAVQTVYLNRLTNQNAFDEISYLVSTAKDFPINSATNTLFLGTHIINLVSIFNVGTAVTFTSDLPHDLETGMRITFQNVTGTGNITTFNNQTYTVTVTGSVTGTLTASFVNTGTFTSGEMISPDSILDYFHYLRAEATFTPLTDFTVIKSTNATPIKITLNKRTYLRSTDQITISGITGNTNANGTFYLKQANEFDYFLYSDSKLRTPIAGNGIQAGIGIVSEVIKSTLKFKRSDEKGSIYGQPTVTNPYFQQSTNLIKILPIEEPCTSINIDYIRVCPFQIDANDATMDLTNFIPLPFQYDIIAETAKVFAEASRDINLTQTTQLDIVTNP